MLTMLLLASQDVMATKVFQWTDEEGVVHFSDTPPAGNQSPEVEELNFVDYTDEETVTDEYSIVNQLERMTEWRRQTTEERLAKKKLELEEKRLAQEQERDAYQLNSVSPREYYQPAYYYPYPMYVISYNKRHDHHLPGHHVRAGHGHHGKFTGGSHQFKSQKFKVGARF
jgi:hypothetical protein